MKKKNDLITRFALFTFLLSLPLFLFSKENKKFNCLIKIESIRKSEYPSKNELPLIVKDKQECQQKAEFHKTNFAPHLVKEKT